MKSYNHLYEQYLSEENYYKGVKNATATREGRSERIKRRGGTGITRRSSKRR